MEQAILVISYIHTSSLAMKQFHRSAEKMQGEYLHCKMQKTSKQSQKKPAMVPGPPGEGCSLEPDRLVAPQ
jgi:hypothetical protein